MQRTHSCVTLAVLGLLSGACASSAPGGGSSGGSSGESTGGMTGSSTGGATASGGVTGSGGATASGGATGSGGAGATSTGGQLGTGGGTGGSASTGGSTGTGGTTSTGGTAGATGGATGPGGRGGTSSTGGGAGRGPGGHGAGGATGGSTGSGGAGGATAYNPCPTNGDPCKILPLGDSITHGFASSDDGGYRSPLFKLVAAANQKVTFTGSLRNGPTQVSGQTFPRNHEGHDGWGISRVNPNSGGSVGLTTVIPTPALASSNGGIPHIILLHIGTNDSGTYSASQLEGDLRGLIDKVIAAAPDALVVVAQIVPLGYGTNAVIKAYNQAIPGIVQAEVAAGKHVVLVDMFTGFNVSTMIGSDSVHPNDSGYQFMANRWYAAVGPLLPK
jgi:lysophospholipase L1-like esterase